MDRRTFLKKIGAAAVGAYLVTMFPGVFANAAPSTIT
ncbi:MAG: twin-arginine translocation signal domain-containing protein [Actinomycetota bacterium]